MGKLLELYVSAGNCTLIEVAGCKRTERLKGAYSPQSAQDVARSILETEEGFAGTVRIIDTTGTVCRSGEMTVTLAQLQQWAANGGGSAPNPGSQFRHQRDTRADEARRAMGCHLMA